MTEYKAIIFDLDGVLANTEPGIFRIHQDILRISYNRIMPAQDYHDLFGLDYHDSARFLIRKYAIPITPQELAEQLHTSVVQRIAQVVEPMPSSQGLVRRLAERGMRMGLASNSPSDYVRSVVAALDLSTYFPDPVCRDDVQNGKPAADPYLEACRRAEANPADCLAVEDSPVGLQAALAAGMECALVGRVELPVRPPKTHLFAEMSDLQNCLLN